MSYFPDYSCIVVQPLSPGWPASRGVETAMLRLDLLHPEISGNKWFKLKYNLEAAKQQDKNTLLTFGGAWSNHIAATAAACELLGLNSIGIIRGLEYDAGSTGKTRHPHTNTLVQATEHGMQLHFISREQYRHKHHADYIRQLSIKYNDPYIIPEGGDNAPGIKGCREILSFCDVQEYSHICCAVGTGTTLAGLIDYCKDKTCFASTTSPACLGFPALKNAGYLKEKIACNLSDTGQAGPWDLVTDYHFGGFAKKTGTLSDFIEDFTRQYHIPLDFVYTAKMMYGIMDLIQRGYFPPGSRVLAVHTGGLQGNGSLRDVK